MPDAERETGWRSLVEIAKGQTEMSGASPGTSEFTDSFSRYSPHLNWLLKTALAMIAIGIGCMVLGAAANGAPWHWVVVVALVIASVVAAGKQSLPWIMCALQASIISVVLQGVLLALGEHRAAVGAAFFTLVFLPALASMVGLWPIATKLDALKERSPAIYDEIVRRTRVAILAICCGVANTAFIMLLPDSPRPAALLLMGGATVVVLALIGVGIFRIEARWLFSRQMTAALLVAKAAVVLALLLPDMTASLGHRVQDFNDGFIDAPEIVTFQSSKDIRWATDDKKGRRALWFVEVDGRFELCYTRSVGLVHNSRQEWQIPTEADKKRISQWVDAEAARKKAELAEAERIAANEKAARVEAEQKAKELEAQKEAERLAELKRIEDERIRGEAERIEAERIAAVQREAERLRLAEEARRASYVGALPGGQFDYAVFVVSNATKRLADATSAIVEELSVQNKKATGSLFSEAFACEQGFEAFFEGRGSADITAMSLATVASHLLLVHAGTPTSEPLKGDFDGAYTYTMPLTAVIIDASNGTRVGELVVSEVSGAGMMSEAAARSAFLERAAQVLVARLTALQARAGTE